MFREYIAELKNYSFLQKIVQGYYLDAKDEGRWKVGKVQKIRKVGHKLCIDVMFDGYPSKYNESYDIPSYSKLAPFRKITVPYTGPYGQQPRREQSTKSLQHYIKSLLKFSQQMENEGSSLKSEYINQFLRGQVFIFVDYCLTTRQQLSKYNYEECMRLFYVYIETFDKILEKVLQFLKEIEKQGNVDQSYIYVHPKMALLYATTEFLFNCNSMTSAKEERVTFHSYHGKHQAKEQVYVGLIEKMKSHKLYEKCHKLMAFKTLTGGKSLPWSIKKEALILMKSMNPDEKIQLPKDTKEVIEFLQYLPYLTRKSVLTMDEEERYRNDLIFHLILNGNFQGKLIGLAEIKKLISSAYYNYKKDAVILEQIKDKNLVGYFLDNNNFNSELFKRSLVVLEYAYKSNLFTKEHFCLVLKLHKDKHELQLQSFYNSLAQFGSFLSYIDAIECFQLMVKELPFEENFIELVKNYTLVTIEKNPAFKKFCMDKDEQGFGLLYFWQLINSQGKIGNKELISKVIAGFATLLNNYFFSKQIQKFIVSSIKAIKQMKNPQSFLKVIHESLKLCKGPRMNRAIETAERQVNVIEAAMMMLRQQESSLSSSGFQNLFEFLQEVNYISRKGLTQNDIMFLWKMDKQKSRVHLLRFLRKYKLRSNDEKSQQRIISKSLDISQIEFVIKNIFESNQLMEGYQQIDEEHYQTIDELILCYLHTKKLIDYNYKHTIRYKRNQIFAEDDKMFLGMNFYLRCIENTKHPEVSVKAIKRLIDIFLRPQTSEWPKGLTQVKVKNWIRLSRAFDGLKHKRLQCFQIQLVEIYGRMKSLNILQPDLLQIKVKQASTGRTQTLILPRYTSLWRFRLAINEQFQLQNTNFEMELVEQRTRTFLQRQQDLSIAFIVIAKQKNGVSVIIHPSKQQHPHFKAIDKFKQQLCDMIGEGLYAKNITSNIEPQATMSLDILFNLPFLKTLQKAVQNLEFKDWNQIIDAVGMKRLEYQLTIIQKTKDLKWMQMFITKNGLRHLSEVVLLNFGKGNYKTINLLMAFFIQALKFIQKNPLPFDQKFLRDILFYEKQPTEEYVKYLLNCFTLIRQVCMKVKLSTLFQKQKMPQILQYVLFTNQRSAVSLQLVDICKAHNTFASLNKNLQRFLNFKFLLTKQQECSPFFDTIRLLIERGELSLIAQPLQQILLQVRNSEITERSQSQVNELLFGYLLCLYELIRVSNVFENILAEKNQTFFMYLLNECLFHPQNIAFRKFKSKQLRELGFKFLEMLEFETKKENEINKLLIPMMSTGAWRKQFDWAIEPVEVVSKKFTGLKNLAATCYINSLLQQLFYVKNFSSQLMAVNAESIKDKENIVREIQNIFGFLKYSQNPSFSPVSLCHTFILDGQPIDPRVQTDVDEFFHALMDKLERNLQQIGKKDIVNEVFRGEFSNMIIGQECPHSSERIEHFLSIGLEIKNKKTIYQALDEFIKGEVLEGENAYFCDKCDKKVKALKRVCLKDLPQIMIVTLKRFEFDYDTMEKFKLNTYCSFPQNINFLPYTKEGLQQDSDAKKEDYQYRLKGVVIHYGISEAGHYTSYVRTDESEKAWSYFDDERISEFGLNNLEKECFGGIEENPFGDDEQKKKNAYLLIYEKVQPQKDMLKQVPEETLAKSKVYKLVEEDNIKTKVVNLLFEPNIESYMFNSSEINSRAFMIYFHTVFLRNARKKDKIVEFYNKSVEILMKKPLADWYLKQVNEAFIMEFVLYSEYEVRYVVTSLLCQAMKIAVDVEFLSQCVALLYSKNVIPFVKIFAHAYNAHTDYAKYLTTINLSQVVLNLIKGKQIKQTSVIRKAQTRKQITEFGLPVSSFVQRKAFDSKELLQAIEPMKSGITLQEIKELAVAIKSKRTLRSLAIITAKKFKQLDQLKKFMDAFLINELYIFDPKTGEETYYFYLIQTVDELCKIVDKDQQKRVTLLAKLYIDLMKESAIGFKSELMLFTGLFKMSLTNLVFRSCVSQVLNDKENKKTVQLLKEWLKELPNVIQNIKNDKWGWWRKTKKNYMGLTTKDVENQVKPNVKEALSMLNAIIEKHPMEEVKEELEIDNIGYLEEKYGPDFVKVTRKMGFLVEVKDEQGNHRFVSEDQVVKKFL